MSAMSKRSSRWLLGLIILCWMTAATAQAQTTAAKSTDRQRSLPLLHSRTEFDSLAVVYDANTPYALPHVLFAIDRQNGNRIYYINTKRYKFHKDFVNGTYLSLERGQVFFENNYLKPNRRFILGTIAYQTSTAWSVFRLSAGRPGPPQ